MGCDIHPYAERLDAAGEWEYIEDFKPFYRRSYPVFGWLGGVRNYSAVPSLAARRGCPLDASTPVYEAHRDYDNGHSASWVGVDELLAVDYDAIIEDRRTDWPDSRRIGDTYPEGQGERKTLRALLGTTFFDDLKTLQELGAGRVIFWFDN